MKILVVEDEQSAQELMQMYLSDYGTCEFVSNGVQALEAVERSMNTHAPFDLICMDIIMPEMDGLKALKKIRQLEFKYFEEGLIPVKVIMITAKDMAKDMMEAFEAGSEAYITKPFTQQRLVEEIRKLGLMSDDANPAPNND